MEALFTWLQDLPTSIWISESVTLWGYPFVLFLHSIGMGLTAGALAIIYLRLLGVAAPLPLSSLRLLFQFFWAGFVLDVVTGSLLFAASASVTGYVPYFYLKLCFIAIGVVLLVPLRRFVDSDAADGAIPGRVKALAGASLLVWTLAITCGRLIAYVSYA